MTLTHLDQVEFAASRPFDTFAAFLLAAITISTLPRLAGKPFQVCVRLAKLLEVDLGQLRHKLLKSLQVYLAVFGEVVWKLNTRFLSDSLTRQQAIVPSTTIEMKVGS